MAGKFIPICSVAVQDVTDKTSKYSKLLNNTFKRGVSPATKLNGKIQIKRIKPSDLEAKQKQNPTEQSNTENKNTESENKPESFDYSMCEAYLNMCYFNEADDESNKTTNTTDNSKNTDNKTDNANKKQDNTNKKQDDTNKKPAQRKFEPDFENGLLEIKVSLQNEGYTIWRVVLDKNSIDKIGTFAGNIKAFKFVQATQKCRCAIVSAKTYLNKEASCDTPFTGWCNYALDSGNSEDNEETYTINLAIAPYTGDTGKTSKDTVFQTTWNVVGEIEGLDLENSSDNQNSSEDDYGYSSQKSDGNIISQYLHKRFEHCVGSSDDYKFYLQIRKFLGELINKHVIEYDDTDVFKAETYAKRSCFRGSNAKLFVF